MSTAGTNWSRIDADPRFRKLHSEKSSFLWGLMAFAVMFYFLLPIGAGYFSDIFKIKVWGVMNFGLLFALTQFVVAWVIAFAYSRKAAQFDAMAEEIIRDQQRMGGKP